ncbi:MAG: iron-siderophore ABC transporter substrate-binding protein [Acidimicrobiales bacterium]
MTNRNPRSWRRLLATLFSFTLLAAACGGSDALDGPDAETDASGEASDSSSASSSGSASEMADAESAAFPVTIEHKFGETVVDAEPERVVSIGYGEHDSILALGVVPVAVRDWYGEQPFATWPWAQDELGDAEPEVLPSTELNFEQLAALEPDLIIGISSGMTDEDYAKLAEIAPTVAQPGEFADYQTPWRDQLLVTGQVLGKSAEAETIIENIDALYADTAAAHPEFEGATAAVTFFFNELPGAYASGDVRAELLGELGLITPAEFDELAGDQFYFSVSQEELAVLDTDVIVWIVSDPTGYAAIGEMPLRPTLDAYSEGREVVADPLVSGAFSHASPLSIEYVIETLVPELSLALDGDPATAVPSVALLEGGADAGGDAAEMTEEEAAAADAWAIVFDSNVGYDEKAAHLEDAEALRETVDSYTTSGDSMGGISLAPTAVAIDGDVATVTYDVLFGENAAYTDLDGEISLVDGVWVVSRAEFCGFMVSARNNCPS